jgi:hypothetical protein
MPPTAEPTVEVATTRAAAFALDHGAFGTREALVSRIALA